MRPKSEGHGPLHGVRVADFSVHAAGPFAGVMLASLGADVIKIESAARLDITRRPHTMYGKPPSSFEQVNANKRSVTLNLKEPRALELALELVRRSDLVLENFRPGVMARLGLGYPQLREVKPDIIMVSLSSNGQTGPESGYAGYAPMFAALGGLGHLTGYPDGPPVELRHAMDHTGGMMAAFAAVAALCARRRAEVGQPVDVSVRDIATSFLGPSLLDYA
ncbi:MAG: CoA transferase, partial [Dehalococcoidia bacterium]